MFDATQTQTNLNAQGASLTIDGIAGPATFAALLARAGLHTATPTQLQQDIATALVTHLPDAQIVTPLRVRMFLAQAACETFAFARMKEIGDAAYFQRYEMRSDLGNTHPGDGAKYCGRGLLDTTGLYNYTVLQKLTGLDCVNNPALLEEPENAVIAAVAFWNQRGLNPVADAADLTHATQLINGGLNGLVDRQTFYQRLAVIQ